MIRRSPLLLAGLLCALGCDESVGNGDCAEDSDCAANQSCLVDLTQGSSYCVTTCDSDDDCPNFQSCRTSDPKLFRRPDLEISICVDRARTCGDVELCNGLDDDCDGVVDGAACQTIDRCLDDEPCGGWVCQAPENQPVALCVPPVDGGATDFAECTEDSECANGICETGFCSEMCRPTDGCPTIFVDGRDYSTICARSVGDRSRPRHNKCQIDCRTDSCPNGLECVWRDVFQGGDDHHFVCAIPDPERLPLGASCPNNRPDDGDDMCQSGLCYEQNCTRSCGGPGSDCSDVGPDHICQDVDLLYGSLPPIGAFVCVRGS